MLEISCNRNIRKRRKKFYIFFFFFFFHFFCKLSFLWHFSTNLILLCFSLKNIVPCQTYFWKKLNMLSNSINYNSIARFISPLLPQILRLLKICRPHLGQLQFTYNYFCPSCCKSMIGLFKLCSILFRERLLQIPKVLLPQSSKLLLKLVNLWVHSYLIVSW